jgi:hypothetical protein
VQSGALRVHPQPHLLLARLEVVPDIGHPRYPRQHPLELLGRGLDLPQVLALDLDLDRPAQRRPGIHLGQLHAGGPRDPGHLGAQVVHDLIRAPFAPIGGRQIDEDLRHVRAEDPVLVGHHQASRGVHLPHLAPGQVERRPLELLQRLAGGFQPCAGGHAHAHLEDRYLFPGEHVDPDHGDHGQRPGDQQRDEQEAEGVTMTDHEPERPLVGVSHIDQPARLGAHRPVLARPLGQVRGQDDEGLDHGREQRQRERHRHDAHELAHDAGHQHQR